MGSRYEVYVVGMRVEDFIGIKPCGEAYETEPCSSKKYILFCFVPIWRTNKRKFTITLYKTGGWCGSGYTTASFGHMKIKEVDDFGPATHKPKYRTPIAIEDAYLDVDEGICFEKLSKYKNDKYDEENDYDDYDEYDYDVKNNVFSYSLVGGDEYYPRGFINVNMGLFEECKRSFKKRPVWIFTGESATGKSTLAYYLKEAKVVFETDAVEGGVPSDLIWADVIVIGNKYKVSVSDILKHLPDETEPIIVNFSRGDNE